MDERDLQKDEVNRRLEKAGRDPVSDDELRLISELIKDSLISELEGLKGKDLSFQSKAEDPRLGQSRVSDTESKECVICGSPIKPFGHYAIEFGSQIRKRANLCGLDCATQFIEALKETKGL